MRIFTKSLLTLGLLCVAGVVSAQQTVKGWFEVDVTAYANEAREGHRVTVQPANTTEDGAYVVYARSSADAAAAGDMPVSSSEKDPTDEANYVDWDTQFFLDFPAANAIPQNGKFRLRMKVKADNAMSIGTQSHKGAGNYKHWDCIGSVNFTEEWEDYDSGEKTASSDMDGFYCIAFQLGKGTENTYYFKDVVLEVYGDKPATPTVISENGKWTQLIVNGDMEGTEDTSYRLRYYPYEKGDPATPIAPVDGVGVDGTRGLKVESHKKQSTDWDTQFWLTFSEEVPAGTKLHVQFDYRSERDLIEGGAVQTQSHTILPGEIWPGTTDDSYIHYQLLGDITFTPTWQLFDQEITVSSDQAKADKMMGSIAFNMNRDSLANIYYFDNVSVERYALLNDVKNDEAGSIQIAFTEYTNMPDLVKGLVDKKRRAVLPDAIAKAAFTVTVNGEPAPVQSVEYDREGYLYVFLDEDYIDGFPNGVLPESAVVSVAFTNPTDEKYQLKYTRGDNFGNAVEDFEQDSEYDGEVDIVPNSWLSPELESSEPEDDSFCLPATINSFALTFDKPVKANLLSAKLDESETLVVKADDADKSKVTLMRKPGAAALAEGKHTINITNVFSELDEYMNEDSPAKLSFSVGEPAVAEKLQRALNTASGVLEDSEDERYQGDAYAALNEAFQMYNEEAITYTAPSQVEAACSDLSVKSEAQRQHYTNCTSYDSNLATAEELVSGYGNSKFAQHPLYAELVAAVGKYSGKVLTDDEELTTAINDLNNNVKTAQAMFTEGKTKQGSTGIAALVERIRQGAETLKNTFNFSDDDELIVAANNAITDDDDVANSIKKTITNYLYERMAADGLTSEVNMTVFVKNPNVYRTSRNMEINTEANAVNCPAGWTINSGSTKLSDGWSTANADIADSMFEGWGATFDISQDINDLPAGTYKVNFAIGERQKGNAKKKVTNEETGEEEEVLDEEKNAADLANIYAYVKTSESEDIVKQSVPHIGQTFPTLDQNRDVFEEVVVKDGKLTLGIHGEGASIFMEELKLTLVGPADGVDYSEELQKFLTGVGTVKTAAANSTVIYDLQGRRIAQPTKGLYIKNNRKVVVK